MDAHKRCHCLMIVGKDYPVPLKSIDVQAVIKGFTANVISTLKYTNNEANPVEAVFEFPLDDESAVYHFEAQIEDRVIIAECQEKQQAKETYEDAVSHGRTAALLEEDDMTSDVFHCLLGNLPANTEAVIKFSYVTELPLTPDGAIKFVLPTQLNPRYNPSVEAGGVKTPPERAYVAAGVELPYTFTFQASIFNTAKIVSVTSQSDKDELSVTKSNGDTQAEVKLVNKFVPDHDLSVDIKYEDPYRPHVIIENGDSQKEGLLQHNVLLLNFFAQLNESEFSSNHEFIFVIDRSGSMRGPRMQAAKQALLIFLKSLPPGCYFNIIGFGSTFRLLFPEGSREYSEESLKLACEHQNSLEADLGGTEILEPLQAIYNKTPMSTHSRQIMLLTDGEVTNTTAVIDLVRKNNSSTRVFSFGVGDGASTSLIKGVARAGRGKAEFILNESQTTGVVMKTLKAAMQATVTELHLDWQLGGAVRLVQVPQEMPPLFAGDRLIVYAINAGQQTVLDGRVRLKGKIGQRVIQFDLEIDSNRDTSPSDPILPVHRLAAKAQIKELQDKEKDDADKHKAEIVLLSVAANIVSKHTSMVGVDKERKEKVVGEMVQSRVPVVMPLHASMGFMTGIDSMGGLQQYSMRACGGGSSKSAKRSRCMAKAAPAPVDLCCKAAPPLMAPMRIFSASASPSDAMYCDFGESQLKLGSLIAAGEDFCLDVCNAAPPPPPPAAPVTYVSVVALQTFCGSWKLDDELAKMTGLTVEQLQDSAVVKSLDVWSTAVALALLAAKFADRKDEWEMIELKAKQWLTSQDLEGHTVDSLLVAASKVICAVH